MFISTSSHSKELEQKAKNIKQTENLITLRDAILRVANYFFSADPNSMPTDPDLTDELQVKEILWKIPNFVEIKAIIQLHFEYFIHLHKLFAKFNA